MMSNFDAVLLDYLMPEMNGHQLASEIRRIRPETSVVMFSGEEMIPEETRKLVDAVVTKNEAIRELLPTVTRLCNHRQPETIVRSDSPALLALIACGRSIP